MNKKKIYIALVTVVILAIAAVTCALWVRINEMNAQMDNIQAQIDENYTANKQVYDMLVNIKEQQKRIEERLSVIQAHDTSVSNIKNIGYTVNSDLSLNEDAQKLTSEDMNKIIDYWIYHIGVSNDFKNKGDAFIKAAQETGLNPIYILAHAACESAWGSSYIARTKGNYFGINAIDTDPGQSYHMGTNVEEGITAGARWIYINYYSNGYTSLSSMKAAGYATDPNWSYAIADIMNKSVQAL